MLSEETPIADLMSKLEEVTRCAYVLLYNPHKLDYKSIEAYAERDDLDEDEMEFMPECIRTNTLWMLQCYQNTPVGSWTVYGPTLENVVARVLAAIKRESNGHR